VLLASMPPSPLAAIVPVMEPILQPDDELFADSTDEELSIHAWRAEQLRRLGLSGIVVLAFAGDVDWHEVEALVARGCPPELALEIAR
jgi:hypothetical protein